MPKTKKKNKSPQIKEAREKAERHGFSEGWDKGVADAMPVFLWALANALNPTTEQIGAVNAEMYNVLDSISKKLLDVEKDVLPALKQEYDLEIEWVSGSEGRQLECR